MWTRAGDAFREVLTATESKEAVRSKVIARLQAMRTACEAVLGVEPGSLLPPDPDGVESLLNGVLRLPGRRDLTAPEPRVAHAAGVAGNRYGGRASQRLPEPPLAADATDLLAGRAAPLAPWFRQGLRLSGQLEVAVARWPATMCIDPLFGVTRG